MVLLHCIATNLPQLPASIISHQTSLTGASRLLNQTNRGVKKEGKEKKMFSLNRLPHSTEAEIDLCQSLPSPNFQFANQQQQNSSSPSPISSSSVSKNLHLFICFKNLQSLSFKTDFFHEGSQCEGSSPLHAKKTPKKKGGETKREREKKKKETGTRDRLKRCVCSLEGSQIWKHQTAENACCSLSAVW
jgi:hypothetical protein